MSDLPNFQLHPEAIYISIAEEIDKINWQAFGTAYGNAEPTIPLYLKQLFCTDRHIALDATHQLWCSLCHQHAYISTAALPAYDIIKVAFLMLDDEIRVEILDIFQGFAYCSGPDNGALEHADWELELRQKMINDIDLFKSSVDSPNEDLSAFANNIYTNLVTGVRKW